MCAVGCPVMSCARRTRSVRCAWYRASPMTRYCLSLHVAKSGVFWQKSSSFVTKKSRRASKGPNKVDRSQFTDSLLTSAEPDDEAHVQRVVVTARNGGVVGWRSHTLPRDMVRFGNVSVRGNRQKRAEVRCPHICRQAMTQHTHKTMDLRKAIDRGEERLAFRMVWNGANPNEVYDEDPESLYSRRLYNPEATLSTPLILAAAAKYELLTGVLLLKGARVDLLTDGAFSLRHRLEYSPLWHAVGLFDPRDEDQPISSHLIRMLMEAGEPDDLVPFALKRLICAYYDFMELGDGHDEEYHAAIRAIVELKPGVVNKSLGCDGDVFSPLHYVQDRETLEILVRAGANIDSRTVIHGWSPLIYYGLEENNMELAVVQGFLEHGADPNAMDKDGYTLLMYVARNYTVDAESLLDALLKGGADETIVGKDGVTAADIARAHGNERMGQLLASAPVDRRWRRRGLIIMCIARIERTSVVVTNEDPLREFLRDTNDCHQGIFHTIIGFL